MSIMVRKITNTFLVLFLFLTTTGFSISFHYCCDSLVSMAVNSNVTPCCPVENGCCDNETQLIQLDENLTTPISDSIQKSETEEIVTLEIMVSIEDISHHHHVLTENTDSSPPSDLQQNLAILQSFRL
jgi:hypothetical protein